MLTESYIYKIETFILRSSQSILLFLDQKDQNDLSIVRDSFSVIFSEVGPACSLYSLKCLYTSAQHTETSQEKNTICSL